MKWRRFMGFMLVGFFGGEEALSTHDAGIGLQMLLKCGRPLWAMDERRETQARIALWARKIPAPCLAAGSATHSGRSL